MGSGRCVATTRDGEAMTMERPKTNAYRATPTWWDNGRNPDSSPAVRKIWTIDGPGPFGGLTAVDEAQARALADLLNREAGDQGDDPDDADPDGDGLPVFPDIGCKHQHAVDGDASDGSDGCGFDEFGRGLKCTEGQACGRYIGPDDAHFKAIKRYHLAMFGSNS